MPCGLLATPTGQVDRRRRKHHRFCQVVGKLRLAASVRRNHWWNVPFHLTGRGITTRPMGQADGTPIFTIDFDFVDHQLRIPPWTAREFAARYAGKVSPVHHFWHTFDIAHTRFSDRHIDQPATADPVTREAYSREAISFGFWFGDDHFPEPAFYAYAAPEPAGLAGEGLAPRAARWALRNGSHLAVLGYDDARASDGPRATVLSFYESGYQAGARLAGWDIQRLASPGGITDPHLRRS